MTSTMPAGHRVLIVSRRDPTHPGAGPGERYLHEIARRWVAGGSGVSWLAGRAPGAPPTGGLDGIELLRTDGPLGMLPGTAARLVRAERRFDAVVDGLTDRPGLVAGWIAGRLPVVTLADPAAGPGPGRPPRAGALERITGAAGRRATVAWSAAARHDVRRRLGPRGGPIFVVPPGVPAPAGPPEPRAPEPTVLVVAPHRPGSGPAGMAGVAGVAGMAGRGPAPRVEVGALPLSPGSPRPWLALAEDGDAILAAAAAGVPCVVPATPAGREFVRPGRTGWLVEPPDRIGPTVAHHLADLADEAHADRIAERCRAWAGCFDWDRSAGLLGAVLVGLAAGRPSRLRQVRPDIATLVRFDTGSARTGARLRVTDEVAVAEDVTSVLLNGCDEVGALAVLDRLGVRDAGIRLATWTDLLVGPRGLPAALTGEPRPERRP